MKLNKIVKHSLILLVPVVGLVSCTSSGDNPGIEYSPNMYISQAYEPYSQEKSFEYNPNGMTMRLPVNGTIARGQGAFVYPHPNNGAGYEASSSFASWVPKTEANVAEGERLYNIYCWHCHGKKGKNNGPIFKEKKMPGPAWPGYEAEYIKNLPAGKIYHVITFGKGLMGPHAAMLDPEERWKVIHHVKHLSLGDAFQFDPDGSKEGSSDMNSAEDVNTFPGTEEEKQMISTAVSNIKFRALPRRKELKEESYSSLDKIADYLTSNPGYKAKITGVTGTTANEAGALELSKDRAQTVVDYLVSKGVNSSNLSIKAGGDHSEILDNVSAEGRQANRRVEIEIYN